MMEKHWLGKPKKNDDETTNDAWNQWEIGEILRSR